MQILSIEDMQIDDNYCYVEAIIDESVLVRGQTHLDPPEYGPALCKTSFDPGEITIPEDEHAFKILLESLDLDWRTAEPPDMFDPDEDDLPMTW
jgi:hypothetical protein